MTIEIARRMGMSRLIMRCSMVNDPIAADRPRTNKILKVLLPTTLPIATSELPDNAPCTDTANSGALVPKATTVSPMTIGAIPNRVATEDAPFTNHSAPNVRHTNPIKPDLRLFENPF
jgi:hypothetical protein